MATHTLALVFATLIAGTMAASAATDDELKQQMLGRWGNSAECAGAVLTFKADGTFTSGDGSSGGTYALSNGKLSGKQGTTAVPDVTVTFEDGNLVLTEDNGDPEELTRCAQ